MTAWPERPPFKCKYCGVEVVYVEDSFGGGFMDEGWHLVCDPATLLENMPPVFHDIRNEDRYLA